MGKMLYSVTMSLDGFIAGPGGDLCRRPRQRRSCGQGRRGGANVKLERLSLTHAPRATNLWTRVV
jgi:hypothetical protein